MIEGSVKCYDNKNKGKKNYHKGKKKVVKKKDLIIQEQTKKRQTMNYEDDKKKIDFLFNDYDDSSPFELFKNIKTEEGKNITFMTASLANHDTYKIIKQNQNL